MLTEQVKKEKPKKEAEVKVVPKQPAPIPVATPAVEEEKKEQ